MTGNPNLEGGMTATATLSPTIVTDIAATRSIPKIDRSDWSYDKQLSLRLARRRDRSYERRMGRQLHRRTVPRSEREPGP